MKKGRRSRLVQGEHGASLVEMALILPMFLVLSFGAIDLGQAFYLATEIAGAARAGAVYGSQNPSDTTGMQTVAQDDAPDVPNLSVGTPTSGCECADGTHYSANCTVTPSCSGGLNTVNRVNVTVTGTYTPLISWPGIHNIWPGVPSSLSLSSSASMRNQ